jgi:hypothetical protein
MWRAVQLQSSSGRSGQVLKGIDRDGRVVSAYAVNSKFYSSREEALSLALRFCRARN